MKSKKFEVGLLDQYHITIPEAVYKPFANKKLKRVKVIAFYNEKIIEFYAAVKLNKNTDEYSMMFGKRYQKELGVFQNDYFEMQLFKDTSKYGVEMPEELDAVFLSDDDAFKIFESLTPGRKRGIIYAVSRYKNSQTKIDKSLLLCENLKRGITEPMNILKAI